MTSKEKSEEYKMALLSSFLGMPEIVEAGTEGFLQGADWQLEEIKKRLEKKIEDYNQEAEKWFNKNVGFISKVRVDTIKELIKEIFNYE